MAVLNKGARLRKISLLKIWHILAGAGVASVGAIVVGSGWISGTPQTTVPRQIEAQSAGGTAGQQTPNADGRATSGPADQIPAVTLLPPAPRWAGSLAPKDGLAPGGAANDGSVERYLNWTQIDLLDEIAEALPASAPEWLTIECAPDRESRTFAKEIHEVFAIRQRIKALNVAADPAGRGVFVMASGQSDEHFHYAELIAQVLNAPASPVHFGPLKEAKPGVVKIVVMAAESAGK